MIPGLKQVGGVLILGALAKAFGGFMDDDDADYWAEAVYFGAPGLIDQDFSSSVMLIDTPFGNTPAEQIVNFAGGPTASLLMKLWTEGKYMANAKDGKTSKTDKIKASGIRVAKAITPYTKTAQSIYNVATGTPATMRLGGANVPMTKPEAVGFGLMSTPKRQTAFYDKEEAFDWQKKILGESTAKRMPGDTDETYRARGQRIEWSNRYEPDLLNHPRYRSLTEPQQEAALNLLRRRINEEANQKRPNPSKFGPGQVISATLSSERQKPRRDRDKIVVAPE